MDSNKKLSIIILFLLSAFMFTGFPGYVSADGQNIIKPSSASYFYGGMIKDVSISSITFYNGITVYITSDTKCAAPPVSSPVIKNTADISCSDLKKGETAKVEAIKNSSGELVAIQIQEVFY